MHTLTHPSPHHTDATKITNNTTRFGVDLRDYLTQLNKWKNKSPRQPVDAPPTGHPMLKEAIHELRRVDFSSAQAVLVASVPGRHTGGDLGKYGALLYSFVSFLAFCRMHVRLAFNTSLPYLSPFSLFYYYTFT
jgi:hypothetical protein